MIQFFKTWIDFLYYYLKQCTTNNSQKTLSFNCGSNRLSCYDWWKKLFLINWWKKNIWWHPKDYGKITRNVYGDDYTAGCILGYPYFKKLYKMIEKDLCEKQKLNKRRCNQKDLIQEQYKKTVKSRSIRKCNNISHFWRSERNSFRLFTTKMTPIKWLNVTL